VKVDHQGRWFANLSTLRDVNGNMIVDYNNLTLKMMVYSTMGYGEGDEAISGDSPYVCDDIYLE
jgi:hypothetical protein